MYHTYYIANEFQLFMIGLALIMIIWRYPKSRTYLMTIFTTLPILAAGILTYRYSFDGIFLVSPEERRGFTSLSYFQKYFSALEPSAGPYFIGITLGFIYHTMKNSPALSKLKMRLFNIMWIFIFVLAILSALSTHFFYENDFEKPSIWMSFYAMFTSNIWGLVGAVAALLFCFRKTSFMTSLFNLPLLHPVYKLTYATYLCSLSLFYVISGAGKGTTYAGTVAGVSENFLKIYILSKNPQKCVLCCFFTYCLKI